MVAIGRSSELEKCLQELQHEVPGGIKLGWMEVEFKERLNLLHQTAQAVFVKQMDLQKQAALHAKIHEHGGGMGGTEISREISAMEISMEFPKFPRAKIHFP